jgi:hypothetical protein
MKTTPIPAVSFSGWGSESIPGVYALTSSSASTLRIQLNKKNHVDGTLLPALYLLSWTSQKTKLHHLLSLNIWIQNKVIINPRCPWEYCSIPAIVPSSPGTKRGSLKIMSSRHHTHHSLSPISCVHSSMDTTGYCVTPDMVLDHVHVWFQVTQAPLRGALPQVEPRELQTTGNLAQLTPIKLEGFQMFPAPEHHGGQYHNSVCEDSGQWMGGVGVWSLTYLCPQWLELMLQPSISNFTWFSSHSIFSVTEIYVQWTNITQVSNGFWIIHHSGCPLLLGVFLSVGF